MKICIDVDDYHTASKWDCSDVLLRLIDIFPDIKFTIFFTPFMSRIRLNESNSSVEVIKNLINNNKIEIFIHGLTHKKFIKGEFGYLPGWIFEKRLNKAERILEEAGIAFGKGFKFPWDLYNRSELMILEKREYILFTHRFNKAYKGKQIVWDNFGNLKKAYVQTERLRYPVIEKLNDDMIIYYHSHAQNMRDNGIRESFNNFTEELRSLMDRFNVNFIFVSRLLDYVKFS